MNTSRLRKIAWIASGVLLCGLLLVVLLLGRPVLIEMPANYKGWIVIRDEDVHCPPLTTRGLFRIVSVPSSGKVCTSSPQLLERPSYVRFEYIYPDGKRRSFPWSGSGGDTWAKAWMLGHTIELHEEHIFIGDVREMNNSGPPIHYDESPDTK